MHTSPDLFCVQARIVHVHGLHKRRRRIRELMFYAFMFFFFFWYTCDLNFRSTVSKTLSLHGFLTRLRYHLWRAPWSWNYVTYRSVCMIIIIIFEWIGNSRHTRELTRTFHRLHEILIFEFDIISNRHHLHERVYVQVTILLLYLPSAVSYVVRRSLKDYFIYSYTF